MDGKKTEGKKVKGGIWFNVSCCFNRGKQGWDIERTIKQTFIQWGDVREQLEADTGVWTHWEGRTNFGSKFKKFKVSLGKFALTLSS